MIRRLPRSRMGLAALLLTALAGAAAAAALANVAIYNNGFRTQAQVKELKKAGGGKKCGRAHAKRKQQLRLIIRRGPANCRLRPPVEADGAVSNHAFRVDGRIVKSGPKAARRTAFITARVRHGGGTGYTLRVLPRRGEWELRRTPASEEFPVSGTSEAINGVGKLNRIRVVTSGAEVRALVNGTLLASVTDSNPGAVTGTMLLFGAGHEAGTRKDVSAMFNQVRIAVPSP